MQLTLYLDTDGDGIARPAREVDRPRIVFLRTCKVNPPANPFILRATLRQTALLPSQDFEVGYCVGGTFPKCFVFAWSISELESRAGCGGKTLPPD